MTSIIRRLNSVPAVSNPTNGSLWDVFDEFQEMFERAFSDDFAPLLRSPSGEVDRFPVFNSKEYKDRYEIEIAAPGATEDDIEIDLDGNCVSVKYQKKQKEEKDGATYHCHRLAFRSFQKRWTLPSDVNPDGISAKLDKGVLLVTLPKVEETVEETKKIPVLTG